MDVNRHQIRTSTLEELLQRNVNKPENIKRIQNNLIEILSILINGLTHEKVQNYCLLTNKKTVSKSVFYDYLYMIDIILRKLAIEICDQNLIETKKRTKVTVGFDACWGHPRFSDNCIGILMDLFNQKVIGFHIVHHGKLNDTCISSTDKNSKCMEKISLFEILERSELSEIKNLTFIHDCDLTDGNLIEEKLPNSTIKFDPNHLCKKNKKLIDQICSEDPDLKDLSERIQNYYSILLHDKEMPLNEKIDKWENMKNYFLEEESLIINYNATAIEKLEALIKKISISFDQIDPEFSTNPIESFNHARAALANKYFAFRTSWRIRAYLTIIKWCDPFFEQRIFNAFNLPIPESIVQEMNDRKNKKETKKKITNTKEYKIKIANKKKKRRSMYKLGPKETMVHNYENEKVKKQIIEKVEKIKKK